MIKNLFAILLYGLTFWLSYLYTDSWKLFGILILFGTAMNLEKNDKN